MTLASWQFLSRENIGKTNGANRFQTGAWHAVGTWILFAMVSGTAGNNILRCGSNNIQVGRCPDGNSQSSRRNNVIIYLSPLDSCISISSRLRSRTNYMCRRSTFQVTEHHYTYEELKRFNFSYHKPTDDALDAIGNSHPHVKNGIEI
jgi:hypothetical protein